MHNLDRRHFATSNKLYRDKMAKNAFRIEKQPSYKDANDLSNCTSNSMLDPMNLTFNKSGNKSISKEHPYKDSSATNISSDSTKENSRKKVGSAQRLVYDGEKGRKCFC